MIDALRQNRQYTTYKDTSMRSALANSRLFQYISDSRSRSHSRFGWLLAFGATFCFSFAPPVARAAIQAGVDPTLLVLLRLALATLLIAATNWAMGARLFLIDQRGLGVSIAAGGANGIGMLLFFLGLESVAASMSSMILSTIPLAVLSLLWLRGERFTYRHTVRVLLGLAGVYLLIGPGGEVDLRGVLLLLTAVLCFSGHMALLQWYLRGYDSRTVTFYISLMMALAVFVYWLIRDGTWQPMGSNGWLAVVVLAVVSTYLARLAMVSAIRRIGGGQMSLLAPLETLLTVIWSTLFLHERLTPLQWVGGALIMVSALLAIQRLGRTSKAG
jgi:drug/metabolite transporter (DMT)-like permease